MNQSTTILYPAEFIFPGHPDKLCDAIADALVEAALRCDSRALAGIEVAVHRDSVFVTGRLAGAGVEAIDIAAQVREVYRSAGYDADWYPAPSQLEVVCKLCLGPLEEGEAEFRDLADDQAICSGYANSLVATNYLPPEQWLVQRLAQSLYNLRQEQPALQLGPDGKVLILLEEAGQGPDCRWRLAAFSCSLQQKNSADALALHRAVRLTLEQAMLEAAMRLPGLSAALPAQLTVNGAGDFEVGGPEGDNGLSGKKLVVDAYGPRVPIGGGAWSGKDFFKADRAGGLHARRVARTLVQLGLVREAFVTLGWFPGDRAARIISIFDEARRPVRVQHLETLFDLSLAKSGETFVPNCLPELARWGHFSDPTLPWERIVPL